jgi:hypothetical protein
MRSTRSTYYEFIKRECVTCPFYVSWEEATEDKPTCKVEEQLAWAAHTDNKLEIPYEWLEVHGTEVYSCKKKPKTLGEIA